MKRFTRALQMIDRYPAVTDLVFAMVLLFLALLSLTAVWDLGEQEIHWIGATVLTIGVVLPLALRRRIPLIVMVFSSALLILYRELEIPEGTLTGNSALLYVLSAAAFGDRKWRSRVIALNYVALMGYITYRVATADLSSFEGNAPLFKVLSLVWPYFIFAVAWWFGEVIRTRRERESQLAERSEELAREREENARRAVIEERVRISRELHDIIAHHVSVMGVQAGAARRVLTRQPQKAIEALSVVESSSRQAVAELQRMLGFLRSQGEAENLAPQPGMRELDALATEMRGAGLPVTLRIEGEETQPPASVDLSAYRIVQEALTNTLKHARRPVEAFVTVRFSEDALEVEILDNGKGTAVTDASKTGNGLVGMRERVALHGGKLDCGPRSEEGFFVRASFALEGGAH